MHIVIFGAGGVGGYFGGRLAQAGERVTFIARGEHLQAMRTKGLKVDSIKGDFQVQPVSATHDPREVGQADMILLAVKSWQVPEVANSMRPMIGPGTGVVPLGNGVDAPSQLAHALGEEHALGGLCQVSAFIAAPGYIKHVGVNPTVIYGELDNRRSERVERLRQAFEKAGVNVRIPKDIQVAIWEKFAFIAAIGGVGAVTRAPVGVIRATPEVRRMLERTIEEIACLGRERGIDLPDDIIIKTMTFIDGLQPGVMASMQRDIMEGRPSELDAQNGAVVRMAREAGISSPINEFIYYSLLPQEHKARGEV
jgi:2-dehydropantoate 2-reductase